MARKYDYDLLCKLWQSGVKAKEIAVTMNCPVDTVYKNVHRLGIEPSLFDDSQLKAE